MENLRQQLKELERALKENLITVNFYCDQFYQISQQIKKLQKAENKTNQTGRTK